MSTHGKAILFGWALYFCIWMAGAAVAAALHLDWGAYDLGGLAGLLSGVVLATIPGRAK